MSAVTTGDPITNPTNAVDAYLAEHQDYPDPSECAYCSESIRCHELTPTSQRVDLAREPDGSLDVQDWNDYTAHDGDGTDEHYSCASYEHIYPTLVDLAREQNEQHALRMIVMGDPEHEWNAAGDEPGTAARLRAIYTEPMFTGRRSRMAQAERISARRWPRATWRSAERWARFIALGTIPLSHAARAEAELAAVGIL